MAIRIRLPRNWRWALTNALMRNPDVIHYTMWDGDEINCVFSVGTALTPTALRTYLERAVSPDIRIDIDVE